MPRPTRRSSVQFQRSPLALLCALVATSLAASSALAQQQSFSLDENGEWKTFKTPDAGSDAEILQRARTLLAQNRPSPALKILDDFLEKNERTENAWLAEAYLLRGDAKTASSDEYDALYDYEEVIKSFPGTEQFAIAVEREMDIGIRYLNGLKRRFLWLRIDSAVGVGEELLVRVQERMPGSRLAERANIELADYYYRVRDLKMAAEAYDVFLKNFPSSQYRQKAMQRRIYSNIGRFKGPRYDASGLLESQILIDEFSRTYPAEAEAGGLNDGLISRLDESAAAQMLDTAKWYLRRGDPVSARLTVRRLLRKHPESIAAVRGLELAEQNQWPLTDLQPATDTPPMAANPQAEPKAETPVDPAAPAAPATTPAEPPADPAANPPAAPATDSPKSGSNP